MANENHQISLSKYLATAGIASRRKSTELICAGKVQVNGKKITEPGFKVSPDDSVTCNGKLIDRQISYEYLLLNKPVGYVCTTQDECGRKTVMDLLPQGLEARLYPVGRLDYNTTGLLLFTNNGPLAQRLAHPRYQVEKIYEVILDKPLAHADADKIVKGIQLPDGLVKVDKLSYPARNYTTIELQLHSGKNRVIRRLFESLGYQVRKLDRIGYAGLNKKGLARGAVRRLYGAEIRKLKALVQS